MNLSEGGLFVDHIMVMNTKNGKILSRPEIFGHELYGINFKLNGSSDVVETKGECVSEFRTMMKS